MGGAGAICWNASILKKVENSLVGDSDRSTISCSKKPGKFHFYRQSGIKQKASEVQPLAMWHSNCYIFYLENGYHCENMKGELLRDIPAELAEMEFEVGNLPKVLRL